MADASLRKEDEDEMGDDELNFTEEEARCWAHDPCNQPSRKHWIWSGVLVLLLLGVALMVFAWLTDPSESPTQSSLSSRFSISAATAFSALCEGMRRLAGAPPVAS